MLNGGEIPDGRLFGVVAVDVANDGQYIAP
jgi:hypothetical protein